MAVECSAFACGVPLRLAVAATRERGHAVAPRRRVCAAATRARLPDAERSTAAHALPPRRARRPRGYWRDFDNLAREVHEFLAESGPDTERRMPTEAELRRNRRQELAGAIRLHGGWPAVAGRLGLRPTSITRPRSLYLTFAVRPRSGRFMPHNYWRDEENLRRELLAFVQHHGASKVHMPTPQELEAASRSDLTRAVGKHGGFYAVARLVGLQHRNQARHRWREWHNVRRAVLEVVEAQRLPPAEMPCAGVLDVHGPPGLSGAVRRHGGFAQVADALGLAPPGGGSDSGRVRRGAAGYKGRNYWTLERVDAELRAFVEEAGGVMPSKRDLEGAGRRDLEKGIQRHGGLRAAAERLGIAYDPRPWHAARRR